MSDLTDRIAEVLRTHEWPMPTPMGCMCGYECFANEYHAHVAERVAAELQLTEERACDCSPYPNRGQKATPCNCTESCARWRRWVSAWSDVDS